MKLPVWARRFYQIGADIDPPLPSNTVWEATFDKGEHWVEGTPVGDKWQWLVAGEDFTPREGDLTEFTYIYDYVIPQIRFTDDPEVDGTATGPAIEITGN